MTKKETDSPLNNQKGRTIPGRFKPGQSGNPAGKPKGARNHATRTALELMEGQLEQITQTLIGAAVSGDMTAIKLVLERIVPPCKEKPLPATDLPTVTGAADLPSITAAILNAVTSGQITPGEGQSLSALVAAHGKAVEMAELEKRISALEERQNKGRVNT